MELFMTNDLYSKYLTLEEQQLVKELDEHIRRTKSNYNLSAFWLYDSKIGGDWWL